MQDRYEVDVVIRMRVWANDKTEALEKAVRKANDKLSGDDSVINGSARGPM